MYWEKEIRFRITTRRIMVAVLMASTVANLVIVGTVFGTVPTTSTFTLTALITLTTQVQDVTPAGNVTATSEIFTSTSVSLPSLAITSTEIPTDLPTLALCILKNDWPTYYAQQGDTLVALARATGSTVDELTLTNCLPNQDIRPGQLLYLPRVPLILITRTPTATSSTTPTNTPTGTPTNTQTATPTNTTSAPATEPPAPTIEYQLN